MRHKWDICSSPQCKSVLLPLICNALRGLSIFRKWDIDSSLVQSLKPRVGRQTWDILGNRGWEFSIIENPQRRRPGPINLARACGITGLPAPFQSFS